MELERNVNKKIDKQNKRIMKFLKIERSKFASKNLRPKTPFIVLACKQAYAFEDNILGGSIYTVKENAEALVAAAREIGLEVSVDKTKYMVMSRDQNAGGIHSMRMKNSTFESVEKV